LEKWSLKRLGNYQRIAEAKQRVTAARAEAVRPSSPRQCTSRRKRQQTDSTVAGSRPRAASITYQTYIVRTPRHTVLIDTCTPTTDRRCRCSSRLSVISGLKADGAPSWTEEENGGLFDVRRTKRRIGVFELGYVQQARDRAF
jgi:hypothetical protein